MSIATHPPGPAKWAGLHLFLFILFRGLYRFLGEIGTGILTVSNTEVITLDFTVSKNMTFANSLIWLKINWNNFIQLDSILCHARLHIFTTLRRKCGNVPLLLHATLGRRSLLWAFFLSIFLDLFIRIKCQAIFFIYDVVYNLYHTQ